MCYLSLLTWWLLYIGRQPIHTTLFNEFGSIGTRKIMTFKRQSDFEFDVKYGKPVDEEDV